MTRLSVVLVLLVGCGDDSGGGTRHDAAVVSDARVDATVVDAAPDAQQLVMTVTCTSGEPTITTVNGTFAYIPTSQTIAQNGVVKFVMDTTHTVAPDATNSDPSIAVGAGQTKCLKFTTTGTFGFHCGPHNFPGSVIVN